VLRIVFANDTADSTQGGVARHIHALAAALMDLGHSVQTIWSAEITPGVHDTRLRRFTFPCGVGAYLAKWQSRYDLACIHEPSGALYAALRRMLRTLPPLVAYSFGLERPEWEWSRTALGSPLYPVVYAANVARRIPPLTRIAQADFALRHADHVICLASRDVRVLRERYGVPAERITRVDNAVPSTFLHTPLPSYAGSPRLLFVGTWIPRKGIDVLAAAFTRACTLLPDITLTLLGTGLPAERVLATFPPEVRGAITVVPRFCQAELHAILPRHNLFVLPSRYEGMPLSLLEAMAAGLPCITTWAGAMPDVITPDVDGVLVPAGAIDALTRAVLRVAQDADLRGRLGGQARKTMRAYTWQRSARQHVAAFEQVLRYSAMGVPG
jgi:glycosyltransferase involved in cell wall biosynthesis